METLDYQTPERHPKRKVSFAHSFIVLAIGHFVICGFGYPIMMGFGLFDIPILGRAIFYFLFPIIFLFPEPDSVKSWFTAEGINALFWALCIASVWTLFLLRRNQSKKSVN